MREHKPTTQPVEVADVPAEWSDVVRRVARDEVRIVVEDGGVPVAAIISAEDFARLRRLDAECEAGFAALDRIGLAFADVPIEEIEEQAARAVADVRAENRRVAAPAQ